MKCKEYYEKRASAEYALYIEAKNNGDIASRDKHFKEYQAYKEAAK